MGFLDFDFGFGVVVGLVIGFYFFIFFKPRDVKDPVRRPLYQLDTTALKALMLEIPWVKYSDYDRVNWLNKILLETWPYLHKVICGIIKSTAQPRFSEYIGKFRIEAIEFEKLSLGTLPPSIHGVKIYETNENQLVMEPVIKWAGNPNIIVVLKWLSLRIRVQLVDLQIFATPRITLKPLVPVFPCFASIVVSLMEKPHVDFGLKLFGADLMSIPGLYHFVQYIIKKKVANPYLWPQAHEIPVLDASLVSIKKPVGILHVKVVRALRLLKMDLLGSSDPYVKLNLSGERLPSMTTTIKKKNLNPEWNENFKLIVKEPRSQLLHINVYDWDKVGAHDRLGVQVVPLKLLIPNEPKEFTLDLLKNTNINDPQGMKQRGQIVVELTYAPFKEDSDRLNRVDGFARKKSGIDGVSGSESPSRASVLMVTLHGAENVEGKRHNNPFALLFFRGEKKKSKVIKRTHYPLWNEEFLYLLEDPPVVREYIRIEVLSKRTGISFRKESLGYADIYLADVVNNGRINHGYYLIGSKKGVLHAELRWKTI